jgi:hypothetical protein
MAFDAPAVMEAADRKNIKVGGVDGMPDAVRAVKSGRLAATMRHNSCQIPSLPVILGTAVPSSTLVPSPPWSALQSRPPAARPGARSSN